MGNRNVIHMATVTGFKSKYLETHPDAGKQFDLGNTTSAIRLDVKNPALEEILDHVASCIGDIPKDSSYHLSVWEYNKGATHLHLSKGSTQITKHLQKHLLYDDKPIEIIFKQIAGMVSSSGTTSWVTAFEIVLDDFNPEHRWVFFV